MRRATILTFLCILSAYINGVQAQNISGERRVYYLDATYSMVKPSKLWDPVRNDLAKAINSIEDETTEIYVIAFGGDKGKELKTWHGYATDSSKAEIIKGFQNFTPKTNTMTYLDRPLNDFYQNKVANGKVTYCFLMTDGRDENQNSAVFPNALRQWGSKYGDTNVYGFYVMLNNEARDKGIESIIESQNHLWKVETANVNINLIRLENHAVFNVRNDRSITIPISGKSNGLKFNATLPAASGLKVRKCNVRDGQLIADIDVIGDRTTLPQSSVHNMVVTASGLGQFDFLVTDNVSVRCNNKREYALSSPTGKQKLGRASHYDKFMFVPGRIVPIKHQFKFQFNDDAKAKGNAFAEFAFVDNKGKAVGPEDMNITVNGESLHHNRFKITPDIHDVNIEISFPSVAKRG